MSRYPGAGVPTPKLLTFGFKVTEAEDEKIREVANRECGSLAEWARTILCREAGCEPRPPPERVVKHIKGDGHRSEKNERWKVKPLSSEVRLYVHSDCVSQVDDYQLGKCKFLDEKICPRCERPLTEGIVVSVLPPTVNSATATARAGKNVW
jgi:hypothetical protein